MVIPVNRDVMGSALALVTPDADYLQVACLVQSAIGKGNDVVRREFRPGRSVRRDSVARANLAVAGEVHVDRLLAEPPVPRVITASRGTSTELVSGLKAGSPMFSAARLVAEDLTIEAGLECSRHATAHDRRLRARFAHLREQ
jgi:hypothetical protein